jgi:glycosyltransferase involved in cell wall biosynthesis
MKSVVVIPCFNEAVTIGKVVQDFVEALPDAKIYVFDNNSTDGTDLIARQAGAEVRKIRLQGKGNVIRRMFADIEADIYLMVDGDDTYEPEAAIKLIEKLRDENLDMVIGCRVPDVEEAYRLGHAFGNRLFNWFMGFLFGSPSRDVFSGYRVFSRRFVKTFPSHSSGFEIETELTVHALELKMPIGECDVGYRNRPEGSSSKLNTVRDGWRILMVMVKLFRIERPYAFFGILSTVFGLLSILLSIPIFITYIETGLVPRLPTAVLAMGMMLLAAFSMFTGLILENVAHGRREARMIAYLGMPQLFDRV